MVASAEPLTRPVLLEEQKAPSLAASIAQLPITAARFAIKQVQWVLTRSNTHIGKPFLEGNFAPVHSEVFTQNLPLITANGKLHSGELHTSPPTKAHIKAPNDFSSISNCQQLENQANQAPQSTNRDSSSPDNSSNTTADISRASSSEAADSVATASDLDVQGSSQIDATADIQELRDQNTVRPAGFEGDTADGPLPAALPKLYGADRLPAELSGAFLRVGPNPYLKPMGGHHWFDGDGMVHAVRIQDGTASYCNRWVPTSRLQQEVSAGWPMFARLGDYMGFKGLALILLNKFKYKLGVIDGTQGSGTANTALITHASRLLALSEGDMPYALRLMCDGLLEAVGRVTVSGPVGKSFTAHPKLDATTGELHFFRYTFDAPPYVSYGVLGPQGALINTVHLTQKNMPRPVMMHDFAITENYILFLDNPLVFDGKRMVKENNVPFSFKASEGSRIGILKRGARDDSDMVWVKLPAHMVFHVANAWEEPEGIIKLFVAHHWSISLNLDTRSTGKVPEDEQPHLAVITLDINKPNKEGTINIMTKTAGDFPTIHPRYVGRKNRYAYVATMVTDCGDAIKWDGVAKIDLWAQDAADAAVGVIKLPSGCYNGETVFVPRSEDPKLCSSEDDGYLVTYVHDECSASTAAAGSSGSSLVIWDALTMDRQPLAVIEMPARVPYGFHAHWMNESQVQQQIRGNALAPVSNRA